MLTAIKNNKHNIQILDFLINTIWNIPHSGNTPNGRNIPKVENITSDDFQNLLVITFMLCNGKNQKYMIKYLINKMNELNINNICKSALLTYLKGDVKNLHVSDKLIDILIKFNIIKLDINDFKYWIITAAQCGNIDFVDILIRKSKEIQIYNIEDLLDCKYIAGMNIDCNSVDLLNNLKNTLLIISIYQRNLNMIYYILSLGITNYKEAYVAIDNLDNQEIKEKIYKLIDASEIKQI